MGRVICDMSISLNGYVTGPNDSRENPFGDGAGQLHDWFSGAATDQDRAVLQQMVDATGAVVMGRTSFKKNEGDGGWSDAGPLGDVPCFVVTHHTPSTPCSPVFTFVTDGVASAIERAPRGGREGRQLVRRDRHAAGAPARPPRRDPGARCRGPAWCRYAPVRHARLDDLP